ncbi:MAG TPA: phosphotransferase [Deltaproteobacteria bacterium]|nr:phosphotransferase [Deltaproteobacteria bacterium]
MKALVLAAGLGTRLLPYTRYTPKPLFTIGGRTFLDIILCSLQDAGCEAIAVNTHHLASQIESFVIAQNYSVPIRTCYEPEILGSGGAIKNIEDFWDNRPFLVVNSDIITDIDFRSVYEFHLAHDYPATLVLHDCPEFNTVSVSSDGFVTGFPADSKTGESAKLTFTGIQVLDPEIINWIPRDRFSSSIEIYKQLISEDRSIKAHILNGNFWSDMGTPARYKKAVYNQMAAIAFQKAFATGIGKKIERSRIAGDGSDRTWYRITSHKHSIILADHGIRQQQSVSEADSFVSIGCHLHKKGVPVPKIHHSDPFSGLVFMEDLGDIHLQSAVQESDDTDHICTLYREIIGRLIHMSIEGRKNFDPNWTYQTSEYDKKMILEKECRYFVEAFLNGFMHRNRHFGDYETEFDTLAENAVRFGINGFMHRDFQSRNIMIHEGQFHFIDFQGGRIGPIQYDLASLLADPYVSLPLFLQNRLLEDCADLYEFKTGVSKDNFIKGYRYCAVTRNLQILGAFGFLSRVKKKQYFAQYIPKALKTLKQNFDYFPEDEFPKLTRLVKELDVA